MFGSVRSADASPSTTRILAAGQTTAAAAAGDKKKTPSYKKLLSKLRGAQKVFSVLVVGDVASGPIPLLSSLLDPGFLLRWEAASVHEGLWEWAGTAKRATLQLAGMTLDPGLAFEAVRNMFVAEVRRCDIVVLTFSLLSPQSLQHAILTHNLMAAAASSKHDRDPIVFLVGTMRELRDACMLGTYKHVEAYHELVRHYVNQKLLSTEDAKAFASGNVRLVAESKIREAMLAVNATSYTEVCFLPQVGNAAEVFSAMTEKACALRRTKSVRSGHRRSRSSASSATVPETIDTSDDEDGEDAPLQQLVGLAAARFPDAFVMGENADIVSKWVVEELPTVVRPLTPRDGMSRSAYKLLLASSPAASAEVASCPREGYQRVEWPSGDSYAGTWRNHLYDGQGTLVLASGAKYTGGFLNGLFHGQGLFQSPDKSSYSGNWNEGRRNGKGEQVYADGSKYVGMWKDDLRHGDGVLSYVNGTIYAGGFQDDQFHGAGRYTFNTGSTYEGEWKQGKKQGPGVLHRFDGSLRRLTYQDDVLLAQETVSQTKEPRAPSLRSQLASSAFSLLTALDISQLHVDENNILGEGFYGIVYGGTYKKEQVAVKRLRPNIPDNVLAKFLSEVSILAGLQNDYIVRYLGAVFEEQNLCIVTAFYGGGTLWEKIHDKSSQFTLAFIHKISLEIAVAMRYLHHECQPAVVHRDLKSPNVLLTTGLQVKLADFGLARHLQSSVEMTKGIGTASWTAPEILRSQPYSTSADVYSFAVVVWELFARTPPFHPMERDQILLAVAVDNLRPDMPATVPVAWRSLIENCWQTDPAERPVFKDIVEWLVKIKV